MPELPEVEITRKKLVEAGVIGQKIRRLWLDYPPMFRSLFSFKKAAKEIAGRKIIKIGRRGKVIFIELSGKRIMALHFKMSGSVILGGADLNLKFVHFKACLGNGRCLYFCDSRKFGAIWYCKPSDFKDFPYLSRLGKDFLKIHFQEFKKRLKESRGQVKPFLLRQDVFAGIGNIIADEALWLAKIHPKIAIHRLAANDIRRLFESLKKVIKISLKHGGTSMRDWRHPDAESGNYQKNFKIYRQKFCRRCRSDVVKINVGGRNSSICPKCQYI